MTFLQFGPHRQLSEPTPFAVDPEGSGQFITVELRQCSSYLHQDGWEQLTETRTGALRTTPLAVINAFYPGAMIRHDAFKSETRVAETPAGMLLLYFALIGCLSLPINRGAGVLVVPDVDDLLRFAEDRPALTPTSAFECRIGGISDAVLQLQTRARAQGAIDEVGVPGCWGMKLTPTTWNKKQKARVHTFLLERGRVSRFEPEAESSEDRRLHRFQLALAELAPRVVTRTVRETQGRGRRRVTIEREQSFLTDSVVRPLVADNLASGLPWYAGFVRLFNGFDANGNPLRTKLQFERQGLNAMTNTDTFWDHEGEAAVVRAVHEALRLRYGRIADENKHNQAAMKNRFSGEYDRWRLAFAGAKTANQFRPALCNLFSRAGNNSVLRTAWTQVLPFLDDRRWQLTRDLALLALASYAGKGEADQPGAAEATGDAGETTPSP